MRFNCNRVRIGDGVIFGDSVRIDADDFAIGDFGFIYDYCFFPGPGAIRIGHNFWMGTGAVIDAAGGTSIGDNVCIGVRSQLWTHMRFGDVLMGCRFNSLKALAVGDDAWISSGCIVAPVPIAEMSVALAGSVVTRPMRSNRCYAGVPAEDVTEKVGVPFVPLPIEDRVRALRDRLALFDDRRFGKALSHVSIVTNAEAAGMVPVSKTAFNVADRTYTKRGTRLESAVMRFLLPDMKFVPSLSPSGARETLVESH